MCPAALRYLAHSAGNRLIGILLFSAHISPSVSIPLAPPDITSVIFQLFLFWQLSMASSSTPYVVMVLLPAMIAFIYLLNTCVVFDKFG